MTISRRGALRRIIGGAAIVAAPNLVAEIMPIWTPKPPRAKSLIVDGSMRGFDEAFTFETWLPVNRTLTSGWHHVGVVQQEGSDLKFFIDGVMRTPCPAELEELRLAALNPWNLPSQWATRLSH